LATRTWPKAGWSIASATIASSISTAMRFLSTGLRREISCNARNLATSRKFTQRTSRRKHVPLSRNLVSGDGVSVSKGNLELVFRNRPLIRVAVVGILIGLGIYWAWAPSPLGALGGLVIFAYSAWLLFLEVGGIIIDEHTLSFPTRPVLWLPIFTLTRARLPMEKVTDLTHVGSWMGMERVLLNHRSDRQTLLLEDRGARRLFFETMRRRVPTIEMYRVHRLNPK
jgi:hypothetical protein